MLTTIKALLFCQPLWVVPQSTLLPSDLQSWTKLLRKLYTWTAFILNIVAVRVLPSPPSPESNVDVYSKESLIPGRLWEATLNWGKGFSFRKGVVLEIVLLRRKVDMMEKTFSSSFVWDCKRKQVSVGCAVGDVFPVSCFV